MSRDLPTIDPRAPDLYRRIIDAAAKVRAERQTDTVMAWAAIRYERVQSLATLSKKFDREADLPPENSPHPSQTA